MQQLKENTSFLPFIVIVWECTIGLILRTYLVRGTKRANMSRTLQRVSHCSSVSFLGSSSSRQLLCCAYHDSTAMRNFTNLLSIAAMEFQRVTTSTFTRSTRVCTSSQSSTCSLSMSSSASSAP